MTGLIFRFLKENGTVLSQEDGSRILGLNTCRGTVPKDCTRKEVMCGKM